MMSSAAPPAPVASLASRKAIARKPVGSTRVVTRARAAPAGVVAKGETMYDKIVRDHVVDQQEDGTMLLFIDRHMVHEVTSPQAFEGLRTAGRDVRRPDCTLVTVDHNVPTSDRSAFDTVENFIKETDSRLQVMALEENVEDFGLTYFGMDDKRQGVVHIIGPEQGFTLPGTTVVCGDSHTATHGAFGALAFGIGTSEVEHVLATQTLLQARAKNMRITVEGPFEAGVTSKDFILHVIGVIGTAGGTGSVIEFAGDAIKNLSMEARMSISNMAIEAGARAGIIAPDEVTFEYLKGRPMCPRARRGGGTAPCAVLGSRDRPGATTIERCHRRGGHRADGDVGHVAAEHGADHRRRPRPEADDPAKQAGVERALGTWASRSTSVRRSSDPGQGLHRLVHERPHRGHPRRRLRRQGAQVASHVRAMVARLGPRQGAGGGGGPRQDLEGAASSGAARLLHVPRDEPRQAGHKERCASTSNRNFEGRQGAGRTHLARPPWPPRPP